MIRISEELGKEILAALEESEKFFTARDEMNAAVHRSEPRWSPITVLVETVASRFRNEARF